MALFYSAQLYMFGFTVFYFLGFFCFILTYCNINHTGNIRKCVYNLECKYYLKIFVHSNAVWCAKCFKNRLDGVVSFYIQEKNNFMGTCKRILAIFIAQNHIYFFHLLVYKSTGKLWLDNPGLVPGGNIRKLSVSESGLCRHTHISTPGSR